MVKLASASHKALLDQYYQVYPTAVTLDYSFTDTTGTLIFDWTTVGAGSNLLMLTYPHHRIKLQNPNFPATTALGYLTTKVFLLLFCIHLYLLTKFITGMDVSRDRQPVEHALRLDFNQVGSASCP